MGIESKLRGYLWGSACGDALGMPVEFWSRETIFSKYGEKGIQEIPNNGFWTDDTQMMLAIANALIKGSKLAINELMDIVTKEFIAWMDDPGIAPGNTCLYGARKLKNGVHWSESGKIGSKGCGSVMRSGIIGFVYQNKIIKLKKVASLTGLATHNHQTADAACIAGALAVKYTLDGIEPVDMYELIVKETDGISDEFTNIIHKAKNLNDQGVGVAEGLAELGEGWVGDEAFAMAYFAILKFPNNYKEAVRAAVNITGDSDSIGCIAGGILGARLGIDAIPNNWISNLTEGNRLEQIVQPLLMSKLN